MRVLADVDDLVVDPDEVVGLVARPLVALLDHLEAEARVQVDRGAFSLTSLLVGVEVLHR